MRKLTSGKPFPENRFGESVAWSRWYRNGILPDTEHKCCLCGESGMPYNEFAADAFMTVMVDALDSLIIDENVTESLEKSTNKQISKATTECLLPFKPVLDNRDDAEEIVRFFKKSPLKVCFLCLLNSGMTIEAIRQLFSKERKRQSQALARRK